MSLFKFGYKDYLMLLTYISICCNDSNVLLRTADTIQMNLQNAGDGADFTHKSGGSFLMSDARTYVSISASAKLDMFFMDLSIFADQVTAEPGTEVAVGENGTEIIYKGLLGY